VRPGARGPRVRRIRMALGILEPGTALRDTRPLLLIALDRGLRMHGTTRPPGCYPLDPEEP
jgi:hypothetical protein